MSYYLFYRNSPKFYSKSIGNGSLLLADVTVEIDKKMFLFFKKMSIGHYSMNQWLI